MELKQMSRNLLFQICSFLISGVISISVTPFIVSNIGEAAYGFVGLGNDFINYGLLISVALNSMAGRFITISLYQNDIEKSKKLFSSLTYANIGISIILILLFGFLLSILPLLIDVPKALLWDVKFLWSFLFINFLLGILGTSFTVATFAKNRLDLVAYKNMIGQIMKALILVILFKLLPVKIWYIGIATVASGAYSLTYNMYYTKKYYPFLKCKKQYFDFSAICMMVKSGIWNSVTRISDILSKGLDLLIANIFLGATSMGLLSVSKTFPTLILSVFGTVASIFTPNLTESFAKEDRELSKNNVFYSIKFLSIISSIPLAILFSYGDLIYRIWIPSSNYKLLYLLTSITLIDSIASLPLQNIWNVFTVYNKIKTPSVVLMINAFLSITSVFFLLKYIKNESFALCVISGTSCLWNLIRNLTFLPIYGAKCLNIKWFSFYPLIFKNLIIFLVITVIGIKAKTYVETSLCGLFILVSFTVVLCIVLNVIFTLSKNEREMIFMKMIKRDGEKNEK